MNAERDFVISCVFVLSSIVAECNNFSLPCERLPLSLSFALKDVRYKLWEPAAGDEWGIRIWMAMRSGGDEAFALKQITHLLRWSSWEKMGDTFHLQSKGWVGSHCDMPRLSLLEATWFRFYQTQCELEAPKRKVKVTHLAVFWKPLLKTMVRFNVLVNPSGFCEPDKGEHYDLPPTLRILQD